MIFYELNKQQKVVGIVSSAIVEATLEEAINTAGKLKFTTSSKLRDDCYYILIKRPSAETYMCFKILTETQNNNQVEYTAVESAYDELASYSYIKDIRPQNHSAKEMLTQILSVTRYQVGYVADTSGKTTNFYYKSVLESLQELTNLFGLEITFDVVFDANDNRIKRRLVNLYQQQGSRTGKRFEYGDKLLSVTKEQSSEELVTALVGRGSSVQVSEGSDGSPDGYSRKITFADIEWKKASGNPLDKPLGQEFLEDPSATALYGFSDGKPRIGIIEFSNIKDKNELIQATYEKLQELKRPKVSFKAAVTDVGDLALGDTVAIIRHDLQIEYLTRVYKVTHNLLNEQDNTVEFGDSFQSASITNKLSNIQQDVQSARERSESAVQAANEKNTNFYSSSKPSSAIEGDLWYKDLGNGETELYAWHNGNWELVVSTADTTAVKRQVEQAQADTEALSNEVESAKKQAQEAFAKAGFNADEISNVKTATSEVTETLTSTVQQANELSESLKNVASETASRYSTVSSELSHKASELASEVASNSASIAKASTQLYSQSEGLAKVSQSATKMEQTMTDLTGRVHTVETTASGTKEALADAQGRVSTLESRAGKWEQDISKKVDTSTYTAGIQNLGDKLSLKANKTDLDGYATKAQLSVESDRITQQAGEIVTVKNLANTANSKIDGLRIGGRNLLKNSDTMDGWYRNQLWTKLSDTRKGCAIWQYTNGRWNGLSTWVYVEKGEIYTFSVDARLVDRESVLAHMYIELNVDNENGYNKATIRYENSSYARNENTPNLSKEWNRYKVTFVATSNGYVRPRIETDDYATLQISRPKLEEGNVATPWQPSDLDLPDTIVSTVTTTTNAKQIVDSSGIYSEVTKLVDTKVGDVTTQLNSYKHTVDDTGNKLKDVMGALKLDSNGNLTSNFNELIKTASGVRETYNELSGKIDGIVVGGKNLLDGTATMGNNGVFTITSSSADKRAEGYVFAVKEPTQDGEQYILSFDAMASTNGYRMQNHWYQGGISGSSNPVKKITDQDGNVVNAQAGSDGVSFTTLTTSWKRYWYLIDTGNSGGETRIIIGRLNDRYKTGPGWVKIRKAQLEKGNKPSDWGMSDNDINKKISDANASIAKTNETIKTVDGNVTTVRNSLDKTKSVVTQLANLFDVTVGDSNISVTNGGVLVKGKQIHIDGQTVIDNASIDGAKIKSLDAGKITTGTLDAAAVKVINIDASKITSGTISGNNLSLNLNDGTVSFKKGKIVSNNNKLILNIDDGSLAVGDASQRQGMMFNQGKMYLYDQGYFGNSTWNGNVYDWILEMKKHPYAVLEYSSSFSGTSGSIFGGSGANFHSTSGVAIAYDKNVSQTASAGTTSGIFDDWNPLDGHGVFINENGIAMGAEDKLVSIVGGTSFRYGQYSIWNYKPTILVGTNLWTDNVYDHGYNVYKMISDGPNIYMQASALITDTTAALFRVENGDVEFAIKGNDKNVIINASSHTSNGLIVKGSQNVTNWLGCQDLTVRGAKNAVVQTSQGWTKINAYETAEYYFGDLGTTNTGANSLVRIDIDPIFKETVNTNIQYQVFLTSYGPGYAWVSERTENYFVIESNTPNLEVGYEIKAKRKGYESVRLEIDRNMEERTNE